MHSFYVTNASVKEALRRHPSATPLNRHKVSENFQLSKYTVRVGTTVVIQIFALHHNKEHFPDPDSFQTQRFLPNRALEESLRVHSLQRRIRELHQGSAYSI